MINRSREKETTTKQESDDILSTSSSRLWKESRIVRVPRAFGGKDRHSKVSTIRGLRDRRVRLSVPTVIQLYDLQDKLGVNQPSKVVDWLLNAAQHEIDKLPPLPFPPASFARFCGSLPISQGANLSGACTTAEDVAYPTHRNVKCADETGDCHLALFSSKTNDEGTKVASFALSLRAGTDAMEGGNSIRVMEAENDEVGRYHARVSADVSLPRANDDSSSLAGLGSNVMISYDSCYHLDSASLNGYEHQLGGGHSVPSPLSLSSGSQLVFYASGGMPPSMVSPYMTTPNGLNPVQLNPFQAAAAAAASQSSSATLPQSGSPMMVRPSQPRLSSSNHHHNPYNHQTN